jgi:hypothetical protein
MVIVKFQIVHYIGNVKLITIYNKYYNISF